MDLTDAFDLSVLLTVITYRSWRTTIPEEDLTLLTAHDKKVTITKLRRIFMIQEARTALSPKDPRCL